MSFHAYGALLKQIKDRIRSAQYEALKTVNRELVRVYWDIGRMIVSRQKKALWGESIVERLAKDLQVEFPGMKGFSVQNLWYMRQFYSTYENRPKLQPLVGEISWSHNLIIMSRCNDLLEKEFYIRMSRKFGWSKNILTLQIENQTYEKTLTNQTNFKRTLSSKAHVPAKLSVKDEYTFDFLDLREEHSERQFHESILSRIPLFLREMGGLFTFVGSQYRLEVGGEEFFIDLLLYQRRLKCLVAIDLLCGAPHNNSSVASAVMWRSALRQKLSQGEAEIEDHISDSIIAPSRIPLALRRRASEPSIGRLGLHKEQEPLLSFQGQSLHSGWSYQWKHVPTKHEWY